MNNLTLTRPLRGILWMRWFFDVSEVKESSFFKSDFTDPPQIFDAHLFENINLKPLQLSFFSGLLYQDHVLIQMILYLTRTNEIEEN